MMMRTNNCLIRCGYKRRINIHNIAEVCWKFDKDGGDTEVIVHYSDGLVEHYYLDDVEFEDFIGGIDRALV